METKRSRAWHIALMCVGAAAFAYGPIRILTSHGPAGVNSRLWWDYALMLCVGVGLFAMAFTSKLSYAVLTIAFAAGTAIAVSRVARSRDVIGLLSWTVSSAGCLYCVGIGLWGLHWHGWPLLVRLFGVSFPTSVRAQYGLARYLYRKKETEKALSVIQSARRRKLSSDYFDYLEGLILVSKDDYVQASSIFEKLAEAPDPMSKTHFYLGLCRFKANNFEAAVVHFSRFIEHYPNDYDCLFYRALSYEGTGAYTAAVSDYTQILATSPHSAAVLYNRGTCYDKMGEQEAAVSDWKEATNQLAPDPKAFIALGGVAYDSGELDAAIDYYRKGLQLDSTLQEWIPAEVLPKVLSSMPIGN